jgi:antitoxin ParD1/3/4
VPTRNVALTDQQDRFIEERVATGEYQDASEVIRAGLRLLKRQEDEDEARLDRLRREVAEGFAALDRGEFVELRDDELDAYLDRVGETAATSRLAG